MKRIILFLVTIVLSLVCFSSCGKIERTLSGKWCFAMPDSKNADENCILLLDFDKSTHKVKFAIRNFLGTEDKNYYTTSDGLAEDYTTLATAKQDGTVQIGSHPLFYYTGLSLLFVTFQHELDNPETTDVNEAVDCITAIPFMSGEEKEIVVDDTKRELLEKYKAIFLKRGGLDSLLKTEEK